MNEKDRLHREIEDKRKQLEELEQAEKIEKRKEAIKAIEEFTIQDKVDFFEMMYNSAMLELEEKEKEGYSREDNAHYAWESYIQVLARDNKKFWDYWHSISH